MSSTADRGTAEGWTVVEPPQQQTPWHAIRKQTRNLVRSRETLRLVFKKELRTAFRQRVFGYFWIIVTPLFAVAAYVVLQQSGVLATGTSSTPYVLHVLSGSLLWACISGAVAVMATSFDQQADLVTKSATPLITLLLGSLATYVMGLIGSTLTLSIVCYVVTESLNPLTLLFPLLALPMVMLGIGIGLVVAVLNSITKDFSALVLQCLVLLMFSVPVVTTRDIEDTSILGRIYERNPITPLIEFPRELMLRGEAGSVSQFVISSGMAVVVLGLCIWLFDLTADLVSERV